MPRPLGCSPPAGGMKPGCLWGWMLKPHCYKPWSCWGAATLRGGYRDIPEQHPLVPGWKRAESGPDGDRTARSQPALDPVPRSSPTASAPVLWLPSPLKSRLTTQAALQSPGMPTRSGSCRSAPGLPQPLPAWPGEVRQRWGSGEVLHELHAKVHLLITSWPAFMLVHHKALTFLPRILLLRVLKEPPLH